MAAIVINIPKLGKMVVGDGMIASAFIIAGANSWPQIIFASGVSNSLEKDLVEYQKESDLLLSYINLDKTLIYFSTVSVYDPSQSDSPYIQHKKSIENLIQKHFRHYLILRLPILVGRSNNPYTLTNFLYNSIKGEKPFNIYRNAFRYLLDVEDMVKMVKQILQKNVINQTLNLTLNNKISVIEIYNHLKMITGLEGSPVIIDQGSDYVVDNRIPTQIIGNLMNRVNRSDYNFTVLNKYYGSNEEADNQGF